MLQRLSQGRTTDERGVIAVITVVAATVMLIAGALAIDLGNTWARRGNLQGQADQAALYAAQYLPANTAAGKTKVAKAAAYYLSCHPVIGQSEIDPSIPACPSSPSATNTAFVNYTNRLVADGSISFPTIDGGAGSYIAVRTPAARIDFGFGNAAGKSNSVQTRTATARVGSPGSVTPMSLSLNCLLSAAVNLPGGLGNSLTGILPLNYIAPGPITVDNVITKWPTSMSTSNSITLNAPVNPYTAIQGIDPGLLSFTGSGWGTVILGIGPTIKLVFAQGDKTGDTVASLPSTTLTGLSLLSLIGTGSGLIPSAVFSQVGTWKVKVGVKAVGSSNFVYSKTDIEFTVQIPTVTQDLLGCARLIKTPRDLQVGTPRNLEYSMKDGLDHPIATNPNLATLNMTTPLTVPSLLNDLTNTPALVSCNNQMPNIYDNGGVHPIANCVMPEQGANTYKEFTDGMLGAEDTVPQNSSTGAAEHAAPGRLICTDEQPCQRVWHGSDRTWMTDRDINDDRFTDFVIPERANLLTEAMFFNLDTYLLNDIPVVTPDSALKPELYDSARFMWVPVISSPVAPNNANYYPVLTYRPIFVTQNAPSYLDSIDMVLALVDNWVKTLLGISPNDDHGLLMNADGTKLRALRFMTIEPSALPAIPEDYDGPITDYVGSGPRVVRLVR
jgi:Flp pilus assembly protein TadG